MTDKELLELAAKAAGVHATGWINASHEWFQREGIGYNDSNDCQQLWNPLTGDGDALRLAVKLELSIDFAKWTNSVFYGVDKFVQEGWNNSDSGKAARRAIVRAAAEIGKDMK